MDSVSWSRAVDWWSVHLFVVPFLAAVDEMVPMAGSPAWEQLDDRDPAKIAAVLDAGVHHVLRVDTAQAALAQASQDVSAGFDWTALSRRSRPDARIYIPRVVA